MPRDLVATALKAANPMWVTAARMMSEEEQEQAARYMAALVAAFPRDRWAEDAQEWQPLPSVDDLAEDDIDVLENVVLRLVTPSEQTAASRELLALTTGDEEVQDGIAALEEFRGEPGSAGAGEDVEPLADAAEPDAGTGGPGGGVRAGRGAGRGRDDC